MGLAATQVNQLRRPVAPAVRLPDRDPPGGTAPRRAASSWGALLVAVAVAGCGRAREPQLFELLSPGRTGVTFANRLPDDTAFNILNYMYFYDGGGVAVGDVNNDGLPDL